MNDELMIDEDCVRNSLSGYRQDEARKSLFQCRYEVRRGHVRLTHKKAVGGAWTVADKMAPGAERVAAAPVRGSHLPDRGCVWTPTHRGWHQGARRRRGTMSDADITSILFGASPDPDDVRRWADEGFVFSAAVPWGLRQRQGGPCAVLAPVQAFLIAELLAVSSVFDATPEQCQEALVGALALILWHARPSTTSPAFLGATAHASLDTLRDTIRRSDLQQPGAIVEFVKSLLRTRTIDGVKTEYVPRARGAHAPVPD